MTISGVSNNTIYQPNGQDGFQQRKSEFQQLISAVQSGNLQQAQQAYNGLTQNSSGSSQSPTGQVSSDFQAIGQALQSGDISGAQKALSQLQQDVKGGVQGHHHHHHHGNSGGQNTSTTAIDNLTASDSSNQNSATSGIDLIG